MTTRAGLQELSAPHLFMRLEYRFLLVDLEGKGDRWRVPRD